MFESVKLFRSLWSDESGVTAVEYGLIAALIAAVIIGVVTTLGTGIQSKLGTVGSAIN